MYILSDSSRCLVRSLKCMPPMHGPQGPVWGRGAMSPRWGRAPGPRAPATPHVSPPKTQFCTLPNYRSCPSQTQFLNISCVSENIFIYLYILILDSRFTNDTRFSIYLYTSSKHTRYSIYLYICFVIITSLEMLKIVRQSGQGFKNV